MYEDADGTKNLQFQIYVENKGDGVVIRKNDYDKPCQDVMVEQNINIVNIYSANVYLGRPDSGIKLSCYTGDAEIPSSEFKLNYINKKQANNNYMTCIVPSNNVDPSLYMENSKEERYLTILLEYGYYNEIEKKIEIQPIEVVNK